MIKNILFLIVFLPLFIIDLVLYKFFKKKNSNISHQYLIRLFTLTNGLSNKILNDFFSKKKEKIFNQNIDDSLIHLKNNGYVILDNIVNKNTTNNIYNFIKDHCMGKFESDHIKSDALEKVNMENPLATSFRYTSDQLLRSPDIQNLIINPKILNLVQDYLGSFPIIDIVSSWWSFPSQEPDSYSAQHWHFDMDRIKWLKVFLFLTDCNLDNGAHFFIKKSHLSLPKNILKKGYVRISEEEVNQNFNKDNIIPIISNKGSILIEDTRGLHKGRKVENKYRLILQIQYSSSLFGSNEIKKLNLPKIKTLDFEKAHKNFPILFSNF